MTKYSAIITCQTIAGDKRTTATVYGAWAVHASLTPGKAHTWSITHVPSGRAVPASHTELLTKRQAIEAARRLDAEVGAKMPRKATAPVVVAIIHEVLTGKPAGVQP